MAFHFYSGFFPLTPLDKEKHRGLSLFSAEVFLFLIVAATEMELRAFTRACDRAEDFEFLVTGVGPVETAFTLTSRLAGETGNLQGIFHFGIAGAYLYPDDRGAGMLDICLAEEEILGDLGICHRDRIESFTAPELGIQDRFILDRRLLDQAILCLRQGNIPHRKGRFITVNCVSATRRRGDVLTDRLQGLCENMEGAAVARVCAGFDLPCLELRCISNFVEDRNTGRWKLKEACARAGMIAARVAQYLNRPENRTMEHEAL